MCIYIHIYIYIYIYIYSTYIYLDNTHCDAHGIYNSHTYVYTQCLSCMHVHVSRVTLYICTSRRRDLWSIYQRAWIQVIPHPSLNGNANFWLCVDHLRDYHSCYRGNTGFLFVRIFYTATHASLCLASPLDLSLFTLLDLFLCAREIP